MSEIEVFNIKVKYPTIIIGGDEKPWIEVLLENGEKIIMTPEKSLISIFGLQQQLNAVDHQIRLLQKAAKNRTSRASKDKGEQPPR